VTETHLYTSIQVEVVLPNYIEKQHSCDKTLIHS